MFHWGPGQQRGKTSAIPQCTVDDQTLPPNDPIDQLWRWCGFAFFCSQLLASSPSVRKSNSLEEYQQQQQQQQQKVIKTIHVWFYVHWRSVRQSFTLHEKCAKIETGNPALSFECSITDKLKVRTTLQHSIFNLTAPEKVITENGYCPRGIYLQFKRGLGLSYLTIIPRAHALLIWDHR